MTCVWLPRFRIGSWCWTTVARSVMTSSRLCASCHAFRKHIWEERAAMLELDAVSTRYGVVNILNQVSLKVDKGSVVCLLGPNGAGKTTTFKAIAGLLTPYHGRIPLCGRTLAELKTENLAGLGVGFVPEGRRLFPEISVRENLKIGYDALRPDQSFDQALELVVAMFPRVGE